MRHAIFFFLGGLLASAGGFANADETQTPAPRYVYSETASRDGIGKWHMGREISRVMGHLGAGWLERPERDREEKPAALLRALDLKPGQRVADIGAGSGYFSRRLSPWVGDEGEVLAVDVQPEMIDLLKRDIKERGLKNVTPVLGAVDDPRLPSASVDLALMVDVYHEFSHPWEMLHKICAALKPGGRVVFVEYRAEDPKVPIKRLHKMTEAQVKKEAEVHGLRWEKTDGRLPRQHIVIFSKPRNRG